VTVPSAITAQVKLFPGLMLTAVVAASTPVNSNTCTGVELLTLELLPNWPSPL
jgi:hypothetical protein